MSMMVCVLVLCGLSLESFRLSVCAGAIQADMTKMKMTWLGGVFAVIQFILFFLGTGLLLKWIGFLSISTKMEIAARIDSLIFVILGCIYIWLGSREKQMEEHCMHPWSAQEFAKYAFQHGPKFLCIGCASVCCLRRTFWYGTEIFLFLFLASVLGLAYGYWQGVKGWREMRIMTGCIWVIAAVCLWNI